MTSAIEPPRGGTGGLPATQWPSYESHCRTGGAQLHPVPETDPPAAYGPQYAAILNLVVAAQKVDEAQSSQIEALWYSQRGRARFAARSAASAAASKAGRLVQQIDARQAAWQASGLPCRDAAGDAAHALVVADLVGPELSADDYRTLVGPWESVMGALLQR